MAKRQLSVAMDDYDRTRALDDGRVQIDGVDKARKTLGIFVRRHHAQGLSKRLMAVEELLHPATDESYSIWAPAPVGGIGLTCARSRW